MDQDTAVKFRKAFLEVPNPLHNLTLNFFTAFFQKMRSPNFIVFFCPVSLREAKCLFSICVLFSFTSLLLTLLIQRCLSMGDSCALLHSHIPQHLLGSGDLCLGFFYYRTGKGLALSSVWHFSSRIVGFSNKDLGQMN